MREPEMLVPDDRWEEISLPVFQKELTERLFTLLGFFDEAGIDYSLAYGTLLGAYREKGFIKHDFDIDLFLPRHEINENANNIFIWAQRHGYAFVSGSISDSHYFGLSRICFPDLLVSRPTKKESPFYNPYIDLYPLISFYGNSSSVSRIQEKAKMLAYWASIKADKDYSKNWIKALGKRLLQPLIPRNQMVKMARMIDRLNNSIVGDAQFVSLIGGLEELAKKTYAPLVFGNQTVVFEKRECHCIDEPVRFLLECYGDTFLVPIDDGRSNGVTFYKIVK